MVWRDSVKSQLILNCGYRAIFAWEEAEVVFDLYDCPFIGDTPITQADRFCYLHYDSTASHYLKMAIECVFG